MKPTRANMPTAKNTGFRAAYRPVPRGATCQFGSTKIEWNLA